MERSELESRLGQYRFYHTIQLTEDLATPGTHSAHPAIVDALDVAGRRVLDVGCRDGGYSFLAEKRGAREVIGVDNDLSRAAVELLIPFLRSSVRMYELNLFELTPDTFGTFDVILFGDVLYHLRYPFQALRVLRTLANPGARLILKTALFHGMEDLPILYCPIGLESPYDPTSCTFFNQKGLTDTLASLGWRTDAVTLSEARTYPLTSGGTVAITRAAVFVCEAIEQYGNALVDQYWHGVHEASSRFAGDGAAARASDAMTWVSESGARDER